MPVCSDLSLPSFLHSLHPTLSVCRVPAPWGSRVRAGGGKTQPQGCHPAPSLSTRGRSCLRHLHAACRGFQQILTIQGRKRNCTGVGPWG